MKQTNSLPGVLTVCITRARSKWLRAGKLDVAITLHFFHIDWGGKIELIDIIDILPSSTSTVLKMMLNLF